MTVTNSIQGENLWTGRLAHDFHNAVPLECNILIFFSVLFHVFKNVLFTSCFIRSLLTDRPPVWETVSDLRKRSSTQGWAQHAWERLLWWGGVTPRQCLFLSLPDKPGVIERYTPNQAVIRLQEISLGFMWNISLCEIRIKWNVSMIK